MRFKRTPTILQMEATECGAAALGIILAYHGCYLPLEELRIACGVSRDGSKAINIVKAARRYGLTAQGVKSDLEGLKEIPTPFIIYWEFNHFIVIERIKRNKIYVNDPETGRKIITWATLNNGFTGVLILFEPNSAFVKNKKPKFASSLFKYSMTGNWLAMLLIILVGLCLIIPGIIIPGFTKIFIDNILIKDMKGWFNPLILGLSIAMILQLALIFIQQRVLLQLKMKMILSTGAVFFWHIINLPLPFFFQRYSGDIGDRINANDRIANLLSNELLASVIGLISMIFFALVLFIINFELTLIAVMGILCIVFIFKRVMRNIEDKTRDFLQQYGRLTGFGMSGLQMIETIKATCLENDFFRRWASKHAYILFLQQKIAIYNQLLMILPQIIYGLCHVLILFFGSLLIMQGHLTVGSLVAYQLLLVQFYLPIQILLGFGSNIQQIRGDFMRIQDVLQYPIPNLNKQEESKNNAMIVSKRGVSLSISKLCFGYSLFAEPLLKDMNLSLPASHSMAFIGKTGSGKSTIARLLLNLYTPSHGQILLDECPISSFSANELANLISMVEQDIFLFKGSVRENLTLWDNTIPDPILIEALKTAEIYEELLPRGGLQAMVVEGGVNFSNGQRQRLEIARSLVKKPKLLVLDEATSSLDPSVEKKIFDNLKQLELTLIIITHRIQAITNCDEIVILDAGKIIHQGSHSQLLGVDYYQQLLALEEEPSYEKNH